MNLGFSKSKYFIPILLIGFFSLSWNQNHDLVHSCSNLTEELPTTADHAMPIDSHTENDGDCGEHFCMWKADFTHAQYIPIGQIENLTLLPLIPSDLLPDSPELDRIERPPKSTVA